MFVPFTLTYKMAQIISMSISSHIGSMPPCYSTLGYIDIVCLLRRRSITHQAVLSGSIIDLVRSEELHEHMVVEDSTASMRCEEEEVYHTV
jgi:hypothetical protein